jgi:diaminohydroxyphosphoribosylaminopyrimidine deaminase/5-amino-6-(5-phosphoribosylamino)uracil reductase
MMEMSPGASAAATATEMDALFLAAAIRLGTRGLGRTWPNPAVGALVVRDDEIIGRGWTADGGRPHAEPMALAQAGERARGATLYVGLEPCSHHGKTPPCANAIVAAGITRVVSAIEDPDPRVAGRGHAILRDSGVEVVTGICEAEAHLANAGHIMRVTRRRPYVSLKLALSRDGKAGLAGRLPAPITGTETRNRVHLMRAQSDAIAVGIGTVLADDPMLTCRLPGMEGRSPIRVVFDASLRLPPSSALVRSAREISVWVVAEEGASRDQERTLAPHGIEVIQAGLSDRGVDLARALHELAQRGISRLMVEGGPILAQSFLDEGLVDEAVIFQSPDDLGEDAISALPDAPEAVLAAAGLNLRERHQAGVDQMYVYRRD